LLDGKNEHFKEMTNRIKKNKKAINKSWANRNSIRK